MKRIFAVIIKTTILLVLLASVGFIIYSLIFGEGEFNLRPNAPSFNGMTVTYDGEYHTLEVQNLKKGMTVEYEANHSINVDFRDAGEYHFTAWVFKESGQLYETYEATLTIRPRDVLVTMDERLVDHGENLPQSYKVDGLVEGDDLDGYIYYDENGAPTFEWNNKNYNATAIGGNMRVLDTLADGIGYNPTFGYLPTSLMPIIFADKTLFENKVITSLTFHFMLNENYNEDNLKLVIYVIKSDLSEKREDCTVENGKKHVIDVKDLILSSEGAGELGITFGTVTVDGLSIRVGAGETLAFGDVDMQFSLCTNKESDEHMLIRSIFNDPLGSVYSVPIIVDGYWYFGGER